jgi:hypothetical protein
MRLFIFAGLMLVCSAAFSADWAERMWKQTNHKMTVEFVDTPLCDAISLISNTTGLNIIIKPSVRQANPSINLKVNDMDAGTLLKWLTELSDTHAVLGNQAIFITDEKGKDRGENEKNDLVQFAAAHGVAVDLPPQGQALTDQDRVKVALAIMDKEEIKPQDFPGPVIGFDGLEKNTLSPFAK